MSSDVSAAKETMPPMNQTVVCRLAVGRQRRNLPHGRARVIMTMKCRAGAGDKNVFFIKTGSWLTSPGYPMGDTRGHVGQRVVGGRLSPVPVVPPVAIGVPASSVS
jgi:hypothetical protein